MSSRKDGANTKKHLLKVAEAVFAEKGYHNTTIADICARAKTNVASINYHFGSKESLYAQVWRDAFEEALRVYPPTGNLPPDAHAPDRLHALIRSLLHRILDEGKLGHAGKLLLQEMFHPTPAINQVRHDAIRPLFERTRQIIRELLGPNPSQQQLHFCLMSIMHQCLAIGFRKAKLPPFFKNLPKTPELIEALVDHITRFSLAGIAAVRNEQDSSLSHTASSGENS